MRIRQVKPDFWRDSTLTHMSDTDRLVYIGLWMEADDAGFLRLDINEMARDFWDAPRAARERRLQTSLDVLMGAGRLCVQECGRHAVIPTLTRHQRLSAPDKRVTTIEKEHLRFCVLEERLPADTRVSPQVPASPRSRARGVERNGTLRERNVGEGVGGDADGVATLDIKDETEFAAKLKAAGIKDIVQ